MRRAHNSVFYFLLAFALISLAGPLSWAEDLPSQDPANTPALVDLESSLFGSATQSLETPKPQERFAWGICSQDCRPCWFSSDCRVYDPYYPQACIDHCI